MPPSPLPIELGDGLDEGADHAARLCASARHARRRRRPQCDSPRPAAPITRLPLSSGTNDRRPQSCRAAAPARWRTKRGSVRRSATQRHRLHRTPPASGESATGKRAAPREVGRVAVSRRQESSGRHARRRPRTSVGRRRGSPMPRPIVGHERLQHRREIVEEGSRLKLAVERPRDGRETDEERRIPAASRPVSGVAESMPVPRPAFYLPHEPGR